MKRLLPALAAALLFGCAAKKAILMPVRHPAKVAIPGSIRTLMFTNVVEKRGGVPGGLEPDEARNGALVKAMLSSEFSGSKYAILNDELLEMITKTGKVPAYLTTGPTVATDFVNQQVGDPGSIGVVEIDLTDAFGRGFSSEERTVTLSSFSDGRPAGVRNETVTIHKAEVFGSVSATIRILSPYPDGREVFNKTYNVPDFRYSSAEAAPRDLYFFGSKDAAKQGSAPPTVTEVRALQFKKLAKMFFEDINPSTTEESAVLDKRGDRMGYNLAQAGAYPWAERRLMKMQTQGKPEEQAANTYNLAVVWEAQGLTGEAEAKYKSALDREPGNGMFQKAYNRVHSQAK